MSTIMGTTVTTGVTFGQGGYDSPLTVTSTGAIEPTSGNAIYASASYGTATVVNSGTIEATGTAAYGAGGNGVKISVGMLTNLAGGFIAGRGAGANITSAGTIVNSGTIKNTSSIGEGVSIQGQSTLVNNSDGVISGYGKGQAAGVVGGGGGSSIINGGMIYGGQNGIIFSGGPNTITNMGTVIGATAFGINIVAGRGSRIQNGTSGSSSAIIIGHYAGVALEGATVVNYGTITGNFGASGSGIMSRYDITNQSSGVITGSYRGIYDGPFGSGAGTITNYGTIEGTGFNGIGVQFKHGVSTLINAGTISGAGGTAVQFGAGFANRLILDPGYRFIGSIVAAGTANTLELASAANVGTLSGLGTSFTNFGMVAVDAGARWTLSGGNMVANGATLTDAGTLGINGSLIVGSAKLVNIGSVNGAVTLAGGGYLNNTGTLTASGKAIVGVTGPGTVVNAGYIFGGGISGGGVYQNAGGAVTNQSGGVIAGTVHTLRIGGGSATVTNAGYIGGYTTRGGGVLQAITAVALLASGTVTNQSSGTIAGQVAVDLQGAGGTVTNSGTLRGGRIAVYIEQSGTVINQQGGVILGPGNLPEATLIAKAPSYVSNAGTIGGSLAGVYLASGGTVINQTGGQITGSGSGTAAIGVLINGGGTVANAGTITGGTSGAAVQFGASFANRLVLDPGYRFAGAVVAGGTANTLELASAASVGTVTAALQTEFVNFGTVNVDAGANWTLTANGAVGSGTTLADSGNLTITTAQDFTGDNIQLNSGTLTDVTGMTLDNGATLSGKGLVSGPVTGSGSGIIAASGGTLELTGAISDPGAALGLAIAGPGDLLLLDSASAVHTVTFGSSGILGLNPGVTLAVDTAIAVGSGTLQIGRSSTLSDANGLTISTGTITGPGALGGVGRVAATVTATGAATISATGGTLELDGTINDSGGTLALNIGPSAKLLLNGVEAVTAHSVTFDAFATFELDVMGAVTVSTTMDIGSGSLILDVNPSPRLTDVSGVRIGNGSIIGGGRVDASVTATGAANITANGTVMEVTGPIIDAGGSLTLSIFGSTLGLDSTSAAHTVTLSGGFLDLSTSATLTVGTAMTIGTGNTVQLAGPSSTLADANGVTLSGGSITGQGIVNAALSGSGRVQADNGTLRLTGPVASGPTLAIATDAGSILSIENTGTAAAPIAINNPNQTLEIASSGNLTINGGAESITNGTIIISTGGQLTDSSGFVMGSGAALIGAGRVNGSISGTGIVVAGGLTLNGGTLELVSPTSAATATSFRIADNGSAALLLDSAPGTGITFTFLGTNGYLALADDAGVNDTISGLNVGTAGAKTNFVDILGHSVTIGSVSGQGATSGTVTLSDGAVLNLTNLNSTTWFANTMSDGAGGTDVFVSDAPVCFCRGTRISTERGETLVEELAVGDRVVTLSGVLKPIRWIGFGRDLVTRANKLARPIVVRRGALAYNVPRRDLYLTHGHALYFAPLPPLSRKRGRGGRGRAGSAVGALIPVEHLVNHRSIAWDETARVVEYYHIELDDHDVVFAEGAPAETYYEAANRALFHNMRKGSEPSGGAKPTFVPVLHDGDIVGQVWAELWTRAGGSAAGDTTDDPDLHLIIDGNRLDPISAVDGVYAFTMARPPAAGLLLRSRNGVPSLLGASRHEHRRLGVAIRQLILQQPGLLTAFDYDAPLFRSGGCHAPENGFCWSDGELTLPAALFAHLSGAFRLMVHTQPHALRYPLGDEIAAAA